MSDTDSLDYLQTGFDPSSLTVPRLRSILVSHDIEYPSAAKKPQLIQIFTDKVLPQSRKILSARARAKRTSRGITDADSQDSTVGADEDVMPPPPTPRARSGRRTTSRIKAEESESDAPVTRSPTKRTRTPSAKHPRASDTETGTDPDAGHTGRSVRKSRRSDAPTPVAAPILPPMKKYDVVDDGAGVSRRESAFTYDNPFQSGSSPPPGLGSGERKRKSLGASATRERKSMSSTRRSTSRPQAEDGFHPPTSATFEIPVTALNGMKDVDENGVEASEEFTPEAQMELVRERAVNGQSAAGPLRPKKKQNRGISIKGPFSALLLALTMGYAFLYQQEKRAVGYCGVGREPTQIIPDGLEVPDWVRILAEPQCEPCPQHAYCFGDMRVDCEQDFVKKEHPLSLGGILPLPPTCEPDGEKVRKINAVADRVVEELRERRAKFECGELTDEAGLPEPTVEIDAEELKKEVSKKRRKGMSEVEFEELWGGAIGEIKGRDEVVSKVDGFLLSPTDPTSSSALPLSPASPSAAPSDDPSDSIWQDIVSKLLL